MHLPVSDGVLNFKVSYERRRINNQVVPYKLVGVLHDQVKEPHLSFKHGKMLPKEPNRHMEVAKRDNEVCSWPKMVWQGRA